MAYDENQMGMGEGGGGMGGGGMEGDNFFLPADYPGADSLKEGDTITLRVVRKDDESGEVEVCPCMEGETSEWKSDLRKSMSEPTTEE